MLQSHHIDGLIINTTGQNNALLQTLRAENLPIVVVDREIPGLHADLVTVNNRQAAERATQFLIHRGYKRIAYFTEPIRGISTRTERVQAFSAVLDKAGLSTDQDVYEVDDEKKFVRPSVYSFQTLMATRERYLPEMLSFCSKSFWNYSVKFCTLASLHNSIRFEGWYC